eukprot:3543032-Rhodomonas_salina.2
MFDTGVAYAAICLRTPSRYAVCSTDTVACYAICIRACYAVSGTELPYAATTYYVMSGTDVAYAATRLSLIPLTSDCQRMVLSAYAQSGTELPCGAICLRSHYGGPGTDLAYSTIMRYAMSGTDLLYSATDVRY